MVGVMRSGLKMFAYPNCQALYQVVKVERGPVSDDREVACLSCGAPLLGREGDFLLKYFMLRKAERKKGWRRNERPRPASASGRAELNRLWQPPIRCRSKSGWKVKAA
jgi:hypothetical protein